MRFFTKAMIFYCINLILFFQNGRSEVLCPCKQIESINNDTFYPHRYSLLSSADEITPNDGVELMFEGEAEHPIQASFQAFDIRMENSIGKFASLNDRTQTMDCNREQDSIRTVQTEFNSISERFIWMAEGFVGDAYFYSTISIPSMSIKHQCQLAATVHVRRRTNTPTSIINFLNMETEDILNMGSNSSDFDESILMMNDIIEANQILDADGMALSPLGWPNGIVPFEIEKNSTQRQKDKIQEAMDHIESGSCVKFVKKTREEDFLRIDTSTTACASQIGFNKNQGAHTMKLGPGCSVIGAAHELLHALGFGHEQNRPDRDKYVKIVWENLVEPSQYLRTAGLFENPLPPFCNITSGAITFDDCISRSRFDTLNLPYDYNSIMHYAARGFAKDKERDTIEVLLSNFTGRLASRTGLSDLDFQKVNAAYQCGQSTGRHNTINPTSTSQRPRSSSSPAPRPNSGSNPSNGTDALNSVSNYQKYH